jgi:RNA polymerase sigma-70 factor (ECF subfamily)
MMGMPALAEPDLDPRIAAAVGGDRAAAEALARELVPRVRNLVRYLLRGDARTDDVAQEALIAVLRGLASFRGEGRFESWVDRVVARTTFTVIKRVRAETQPAELEAVDTESRTDAYAMRREVAAALDRLPPDQREALVLHFAVGMTVPEIAETVGAPFETVRSRLRLGKVALRAMLGGNADE